MPMRTIGMLLGIPEQDQEAIRDRIDDGLRLEEGTMPDFEAQYRERDAGEHASRSTSTGGPSTPPTT